MNRIAPKYYAILAAAGAGRRMKNPIPKLYLRVVCKTVLEHSLEALLNYSAFKRVVVVVNPQDCYWKTLAIQDSRLAMTIGGAERFQSVYNGLLMVGKEAQSDDWVLVHDAARPCLQLSDIEKLISQLEQHPVGGLLGVPIQDSVKRIREGSEEVISTVPREGLWEAFTPQMFRYQLLKQALEQAITNQVSIVDEAHAIELIGAVPKLVVGRRDNIKVTTLIDLDYVNYFFERN